MTQVEQTDLRFIEPEARAELIPAALRQNIIAAHQARKFVFDQVLDDAILRLCTLAENSADIRSQLAGIPTTKIISPLSRQAISLPKTQTTFLDAISGYENDLKMRLGRNAKENVANLRSRARMFVSIIGNPPLNEIKNQTMRRFGYAISFLPSQVARRGEWTEQSLLSILHENGLPIHFGQDPTCQSAIVKRIPISQKTLQSKTINILKTALTFFANENNLPLPLQGFCFQLPSHTPRSVSRKRPPDNVVSQIIHRGVEDGRLVQSILPLLGRLTGRRLGLLVHLKCENIRKSGNHFLATVPRVVMNEDGLSVMPIKGEMNSGEFVLHDVLQKIGFLDYIIARQTGYVFDSLHLPYMTDPSDVAQRRISRLSSNTPFNFHQLRHLTKSELRADSFHDEIIRMQLGHSPIDAHQSYGQEFEPIEIKKIATRRLVDYDEIVNAFSNFSFERAAQKCVGSALREARRRRQ